MDPGERAVDDKLPPLLHHCRYVLGHRKSKECRCCFPAKNNLLQKHAIRIEQICWRLRVASQPSGEYGAA